ncbi:MAG: hypothetical protein JO046_24220 [Solirubrobacterales bacterium]|nr:hypothetical protein [Solirubrobacterales bacterium]
MAFAAVEENVLGLAIQAYHRAAECGHARAVYELRIVLERRGDLKS